MNEVNFNEASRIVNELLHEIRVQQDRHDSGKVIQRDQETQHQMRSKANRVVEHVEAYPEVYLSDGPWGYLTEGHQTFKHTLDSLDRNPGRVSIAVRAVEQMQRALGEMEGQLDVFEPDLDAEVIRSEA